MHLDLLKRLSKMQKTVFSGRILTFLAQLFPLNEKSGMSVCFVSTFHDSSFRFKSNRTFQHRQCDQTNENQTSCFACGRSGSSLKRLAHWLFGIFVGFSRKKRKWKWMKMEKFMICKCWKPSISDRLSSVYPRVDIKRIQLNSIQIFGCYKTISQNHFNFGSEHHGTHLYM